MSAAVTSCRLLIAIPPSIQPVGTGEKLDRMRHRGRLFRVAAELLHPLRDMHPGQRAFGGDVAARLLRCGARDRPADLQRDLEILLLEVPGAAMAGAALDDVDLGARD